MGAAPDRYANWRRLPAARGLGIGPADLDQPSLLRGCRRERIQERIGLLDVGQVTGVVDHLQRPAERGAGRLGDREGQQPVAAAPQRSGTAIPRSCSRGIALVPPRATCRIACLAVGRVARETA
jgi:hypothetical protein